MIFDHFSTSFDIFYRIEIKNMEIFGIINLFMD